MYDYSGLPEGLRDGMKRYVEDGIHAGGFLTACLENDLVGAVNRADENNLPRLQDIVHWLYWEAPHVCWGTKEKVYDWLSHRAEHDCEAVSVCCGASPIELTDCCGSCRDHTGFECSICGAEIQEVI